MKKYNVKDKPIEVFGLPLFEETKSFYRLPEELMEKIPSLNFFGRRSTGGRIGFKTDSEKITVRVEYETLTPDVGMSIFSCQSLSVLIGERQNAKFVGLINPSGYDSKVFEKTVCKDPVMQEVTILFPRNEIVKSIEIFVDDAAEVLPPTPYKIKKPVVFYGSSITETGHASNMINSYTNILSRRFDFDYINLGFSGSAKGEPEMADYINTFDMSAFVLDYDHNAETVEALRNTHEPFFKKIRKKHPDLPILMMTRPRAWYTEEEKQRREVVRETYRNAVESGDKNVWFIDGETFYGDTDRDLCSTDTVHPNDLGFYRMANVIEPIMKEMLKFE